MSIDLNTLKMNVNSAVELSTQGKKTEAFEVINSAYPYLNSAQNDAIIALLSSTSSKEPAKCTPEKVKMLTLISSSPRPTAEPVKVIKKRIGSSKLVSSRINFIGRNFVDNTLTDKHFSKDAIINKTIKQKKVKVICYHEENDLISDFNFNNNGFKFTKFDGKLLKLAEEFSHRKIDNGSAELLLIREATNFIMNWGKENNIEFDVVAPLGLVYRNQDESDKSAQRPIPFAHVDFQEKTIKKTFQDLVKVWKPPMETVLGEMSTEKYNNLKVVAMCNLWMSLNVLPARNTLAVLDKTSINVSQLRPYRGETQDPLVKVTSMSLHEDKNQRWVAHDQMTIGKGIIFNTLLTPHTAVKLPKNPEIKYDECRKSAEIRFAFISSK